MGRTLNKKIGFEICKTKNSVISVPVNSVVDLLCVTHAPELIEKYRSEMENGAKFPPISTMQFGSKFVITDGHKRFNAFRAFGPADIPVEIVPFSQWLKAETVLAFRQIRRILGILGRLIKREPDAKQEIRNLARSNMRHYFRVIRSLGQRARIIRFGQVKE